MNKQIGIIFLLFLLATQLAFSQQLNLPLNREFNLVNQKEFNALENNVHTSFHPILQSKVATDSFYLLKNHEQDAYLINVNKTYLKDKSWFSRKLFHENFVRVDTGDFYLTIDPLLNLEMGQDGESLNTEQTLYVNTRGIIAKGHIGEKFSFQTALYENQAVFPDYMAAYVRSTNVVPGQGRVKRFKINGFDYNSATSYISYSPSKRFNFQLGNDKQFIGDGYRSILLSDYAYHYPYYKATAWFGKKNQFQYTKVNTGLSSLDRREQGSTPEELFMRKSMSVHYLSWIATKWLHLGFFESTIWQTEDSSGTKPYNFMQLNPVLFANTLVTGFDGKNNSQLGLNAKIKLPINTILYGQLLYDGNKNHTKTGYQAGVKFCGITGLTLQAEYNHVEPYTYSNAIPLQNYSHFNEPLGHPYGANFDEIVGIMNYKYKRLFMQTKVNYAQLSSQGSNIFASNENTISIVPTTADLINIQAHAGFLINPKNNMALMLGISQRTLTTDFGEHKTNYIYFALRTSLRNLYSDI